MASNCRPSQRTERSSTINLEAQLQCRCECSWVDSRRCAHIAAGWAPLPVLAHSLRLLRCWVGSACCAPSLDGLHSLLWLRCWVGFACCVCSTARCAPSAACCACYKGTAARSRRASLLSVKTELRAAGPASLSIEAAVHSMPLTVENGCTEPR